MKNKTKILIGILLIPGLIFWIFIVSMVVKGCQPDRLTKYYNFTSSQISTILNDISVEIRISGDYRYDKEMEDGLNVTEYGNPYDLSIRFKNPNRTIQSVTLQSITVLNSISGKQVLLWNLEVDRNKPFENNHNGEWAVFMLIENIPPLRHEPHRIKIKYNTLDKESQKQNTGTIEFELTPDYQEEKSSDWVSAIMSV